MSEGKDFELVQRCLKGDQQAMETLVQQYERTVYNTAFRMLGNPEDAADVTQTTFLKVFQKLSQFNPSYRFFSWIYRITVNETIDMLDRRPKSEPLRDDDAADESVTAAQAIDSSHATEEVQAVLMTLKETQRTIIALRYFTGCSYQRMAEILDIPEKTVKSRLFSARQQIKTALLQKGILSS